jgi:hypothetical protein
VASFVELYLDAGTTFNNVINLTDDVTNTQINIAGYTITSQLRRSYYSANASANLVCTITDAANGGVTLSLSAANTANLKPGRYLFDVKTTDSYNITNRILEGIITVTPQITK